MRDSYMPSEPVISRHRLPRRYRVSLTVLWLMPIVLLSLTLIISRGLSLALLDPRLLLPLFVMGVPALYVWHEGIDVLPSGIVARLHWPRYYPYDRLQTWYLDTRPDRRILIVWDTDDAKVLETHARQLTQLPALLTALKTHVRYRNFPH
jgi:hypothetical protein